MILKKKSFEHDTYCYGGTAYRRSRRTSTLFRPDPSHVGGIGENALGRRRDAFRERLTTDGR
jgi:hypothetical protein